MFLLNSRHPQVFVMQHKSVAYSFSRSYRVKLPSSFNIVILYAFIYLTSLLVLELVRY